jgi:hypothetical protein
MARIFQCVISWGLAVFLGLMPTNLLLAKPWHGQAFRPRTIARNAARIGVVVARKPSDTDETFNAPARLNGDSLIEIQSSAEFSRGINDKLMETLGKSSAFAVYDVEDGEEIPEQVEYVIKAKVVSIGLKSAQGNGGRLTKVCAYFGCKDSVRDVLRRIRLGGEQVTFNVKVAISAKRADSKQLVFAQTFEGKAGVGAATLTDAENGYSVSLFKAEASEAAHKALAKAVEALAKELGR